MPTLQQWIDTELDAARTVREEVRERAILLWADALVAWAHVRVHARRFQEDTREPVAAFGEAVKRLLTELRESLDRMQQRPTLYDAPRPGRLQLDSAG